MQILSRLSSFKNHLLCRWYSLALLVRRKIEASHYHGQLCESGKEVFPSPGEGIKGRGNNNEMVSFHFSPPP